MQPCLLCLHATPTVVGQEDEYLGRLEQFLKCEELATAAHTTRIAQDERLSWFHQDLAVLLQDAVNSVKVRCS